MPGLGCAGPRRGLILEFVAFQHGDALEMTGERSRRREAADTGADDDGLIVAELRHQRPLPVQPQNNGGVAVPLRAKQLRLQIGFAFISNLHRGDGRKFGQIGYRTISAPLGTVTPVTRRTSPARGCRRQRDGASRRAFNSAIARLKISASPRARASTSAP